MDADTERRILRHGKFPVAILRSGGEYSFASLDAPLLENCVGLVGIVDGKPATSLSVELSSSDITMLALAYCGYVKAALVGGAS